MKNKKSMTIYDIFMNESLNDFLKPTKITVVAFFVFSSGLLYVYYSYGLLDTINAFLIGDPENYTMYPYDAWGLGFGLQMGTFFVFIHFAASFVSWIFYKLTK